MKRDSLAGLIFCIFLLLLTLDFLELVNLGVFVYILPVSLWGILKVLEKYNE